MIIVQATLNSSTGLVSYFNFTNLHLQKGSCKVTVTVICRGNPHELGCCPSSCPVNHFVHTPLSLHFGPWAREQRPTCRPNCVLCPSDCQWLQLLQCSTINFSIQTPSRQSALLGHAGRLCLRCSWGVCDGWVVLGLSFRFCLASPKMKFGPLWGNPSVYSSALLLECVHFPKSLPICSRGIILPCHLNLSTPQTLLPPPIYLLNIVRKFSGWTIASQLRLFQGCHILWNKATLVHLTMTGIRV